MIIFSFLLPTRGRPTLVQRLFDSIVATTSRLEELEIVLAVDDDDLESQAIEDARLNLKKVILPRGATMGTLNQTAYEASTGRFVMAMNDDVVLRTPGWDAAVQSAFALHPDNIALIHVNDLLFQERLCTFPMLSREACDLIGFCELGYRRYRIDDHIYDIYNMLAYLGHKRIVYLPGVIFEHENFSEEGEAADNTFVAQSNKVYVADKAIMKKDAALFDSKINERKTAAIALAQQIDAGRYARLQARQIAEAESLRTSLRRPIYEGLAWSIRDPYHYRREDFIKRHTPNCLAPERTRRTTIAVVSADIRGPHAVQCLECIKEHTSNYELVILDNNRGPEFNHPHEMNRVIQTAETDFLVLMDDDILVEAGWLEGLLGAVDETTGVVLPLHKDAAGAMDYAGAYLADDDLGRHGHLFDVPRAPRDVQALCSAILLIDLHKCGHLRMDERYAKYFFDLTYGFEVWEAGYRVLCTPDVCVTHLCGATQIRGTQLATGLWERDQVVFIQDWITTGRLARLKSTWRDSADLKPLVDLPERIHRLATEAARMSNAEFADEVAELAAKSAFLPVIALELANALVHSLLELTPRAQVEKALLCQKTLEALPVPSADMSEARWLLAKLLIETADAEWAQGKQEAAIARLEAQVLKVQTPGELLYRLAEMLLEAGRPARSLHYLTILARLMPDKAKVFHKMGQAQLQEGGVRLAEFSLLKAISLDPDEPEIRNDLGVVYFQQQRIEECLAQLERAMALDPLFVDAHLNYALVLQTRGQTEQGARSLETFLERRPNAQLAETLAQMRGEVAIAV